MSASVAFCERLSGPGEAGALRRRHAREKRIAVVHSYRIRRCRQRLP